MLKIQFEFKKAHRDRDQGTAIVTTPAVTKMPTRVLWMVVSTCLSCISKREDGLEGTLQKLERMLDPYQHQHQLPQLQPKNVVLDEEV